MELKNKYWAEGAQNVIQIMKMVALILMAVVILLAATMMNLKPMGVKIMMLLMMAPEIPIMKIAVVNGTGW